MDPTSFSEEFAMEHDLDESRKSRLRLLLEEQLANLREEMNGDAVETS